MTEITYERLLAEGFPPAAAAEIVARIAYGESVDAAMQAVMCY